MSESEDTSDLMNENFPDTESKEKDIQIKLNRDIIIESDSDNADSESEEYVLKPKKKKILSSNIKIPTDLNKEIPSVEDAINEYYKLKDKFESQINTNKRKIINNPTLSNKEKRSEYLKLMPKCINCKRSSKKGTIFSINYHPADDKISEHRVFKVICGNLVDPCSLHIEINIGIKNMLDQELETIKNDIKEAKNNIINDKNKLLFGLITTEGALENFDSNKEYISELTSIYENYLNIWNREVDNAEKKLELDEALIQSYDTINTIKDCIKKMNENNNTRFAVEAANIYHTNLQPLLNKIRKLKYEKNVVFNDDNNNCILIQRKYLTYNILVSVYTDKVVAYDVGFKSTGRKKKIELSVESDSLEKESEQKELTIKIKKPDEIVDEPIIGEGLDGIDWHTKEYKYLWSRLSPQLRNEFKTNIDWMNDFMYKCVNERINHGSQWSGCKLPTPPNIVIPPREMENGQYDFGISIYNKAFNRQPKTLQKTYLTFYKEDPQTKERNYNMLIDAMNRLVENEVNFGRGFF